MTSRDDMDRIGKTLSEFYAEMAMANAALGNGIASLLETAQDLNGDIAEVWEKIAEIETRLNDGGVEPSEPEEPELLLVVVENSGDSNCAVYNSVPDGRDNSCGSGLGKPEYGSNKMGRFENGQRFEIYAKVKDNCHDNANDPWIHGAYGLYAVVGSGPMKGGIVPAKRITLLG